MFLRDISDQSPRQRLIFIVRDILNTLFVLAVVAGIACYLLASKQTGLYILLGAVPVKLAEAAIRMLRIE